MKNKIKKTIIIFALIFITLIGCAFGIVYVKYGIPAKELVNATTKETFILSNAETIYDKNNNIIFERKQTYNTPYLKYEDIPEYVINAYIAVEDRTFLTNHGYSVKGILRSLFKWISDGELTQGGSTITQQLSRNIFLTHEVSAKRKIKEIFISKYLTNKYTKEEIMEFYVNDIYYSNGYYGIEAAANGYFDKTTNELSLSEIAYLCAIPNGPTYFDPRVNPQHTITRRNKILHDMLSLGYITNDEYQKAIVEIIEPNNK